MLFLSSMKLYSNLISDTNLNASCISRVIVAGRLYPSKNMSSEQASFLCIEMYLI